jgi:tetratricopeptide (TPR) repeat protein
MTLEKFKANKILLKFIFILGIVVCSQNVFGSSITGIVYDNQRNPVSDIDIELLDDFYRAINRTRTDTSGRYEFGGLKDGRYSVRVLAFRFDFIDETAAVEISTITSGVAGQIGNAIIPQDFYLQPKKGSLLEAELGVVFAQAIPKEAERIYANALKSLSQKKTDEGILQLRESIKLFPTYYLALHRLGRELFFKGDYGESAQMSLRATEVNPKSGTSFYYLGNALSKLNYNKAAIVALNQALIIAPSSVQVLYVLGKAENAEGKYANAEKYFLEAKKLSKTPVPDIHWELAQLYGNGFKKYKEAADELELYLKAGKFDDNHMKTIRKIINNLREKAKTQVSKT